MSNLVLKNARHEASQVKTMYFLMFQLLLIFPEEAMYYKRWSLFLVCC